MLAKRNIGTFGPSYKRLKVLSISQTKVTCPGDINNYFINKWLAFLRNPFGKLLFSPKKYMVAKCTARLTNSIINVPSSATDVLYYLQHTEQRVLNRFFLQNFSVVFQSIFPTKSITVI